MCTDESTENKVYIFKRGAVIGYDHSSSLIHYGYGNVLEWTALVDNKRSIDLATKSGFSKTAQTDEEWIGHYPRPKKE